MKTPDDPREFPIIGDEIARKFPTALGGCVIRTVTRSHGGFVFFDRDNGAVRSSQIVSLKKWQKWAKKSEILKIGGEWV